MLPELDWPVKVVVQVLRNAMIRIHYVVLMMLHRPDIVLPFSCFQFCLHHFHRCTELIDLRDLRKAMQNDNQSR